jgi:N utilization substance protein B
MDIAGTAIEDVLAEFGSGRLGEAFEDGECGAADFPLLKDIVSGVLERQRTIDKAVNACLAEGWTLARLDSTLRAILRAASYELLYREDIPAKVTINEYVDVAKAFFGDGEEPGFVNGVLDTLGRNHRQLEFEG